MPFESCRDLLLNESLSDDDIRRLLTPVGLSDWRAANRCLQRLAVDTQTRQSLAGILPEFLLMLSHTADPDRALVNFERFTNNSNPLALFPYLAKNPRVIEILVTLFSGSQFLTEILLRSPEYLTMLAERKQLAQHKNAVRFREEALSAAAIDTEASQSNELFPTRLDALRRYQRGELLRIGACDLLNLFDIPTVTAQLSDLADSLVQACLSVAVKQTGISPDKFVVLAMGKLGGQELNYSSDIDLFFLAASNAGDYIHLGECLIEALASVTAEGFLYRVDMRLRPWGKDGALVSSVDGYISYLERHAHLWEKQALLKARLVAGDQAVGNTFLSRIEPLLFGLEIDFVRTSVFAMKQRTEDYLRQRGRQWGEVKLGEGSIRDVEFVIQFLQLVYGAEWPRIRSRSTLEAIPRIMRAGLLTPDEARILTEGYVFLRTIEHYLQMMHYQQTDTLPDDPGAIALLARRLGFEGEQAGGQFLARYQEHGTAVREVYLRYVGSDDEMTEKDSLSRQSNSHIDIRQHMARMDSSYVEIFSEKDIQRHASMADLLDEDHLVVLDAVPLEDGRWRVSIVGYDYPGELSLFCGLMFVYGLNINDGDVFTYEPIVSDEPVGSSETSVGSSEPRASTGDEKNIPTIRRKIVDVFTVSSVLPEPPTSEMWSNYSADLTNLLRMMRAGQRREARGELAKRVGAAFQEMSAVTTPLYPVDIEIDNQASDRYTVLRINTPDTIGFLYEFTNALAFNRIYIARVSVRSVGSRAQDTLYVTDADGRKITSLEKQRELRAAIVLVKHFTHLLPHSPNPESALLHFREFISQLFQRPNWPDELASIERSDVLHALARLLGVSDFLWDDFLRMQYANLFPVVRDVDALATSKSREQVKAELDAALSTSTVPGISQDDWRMVLNAFKDREMFRVDMRHILGHTPDFWTFAAEMTDLVELVVDAACRHCEAELRVQYGTPLLDDGSPCSVAILALGKCGGRELGFASDIELMFVYAGKGQTTGPHIITTGEYYDKLVQSFVGSIQAKQEGIFKIDLQLRPYGKAGSMAVPLDAFRRYFAPDGPAWAYERQALVKLRPIAGDLQLGQQISAFRDEFVYNGEPFDVTAMRAMRERQIRHLVIGGTFNTKYSPGGLVDVEYLVQGLQITCGANDPSLRLTNIREAMAALATAGILSPEDYMRLRKAHTFLRWLIDSLRVVRGNAKDVTIPAEGSEEFAFLARRLLYGGDIEHLREDLRRYTSDVQELNARLLSQPSRPLLSL